jgi:hypothetical protein
MKFKAVFDDSGGKGQGRYMAVSGLFGEAQLLAALADQWQERLEQYHPGLPFEYFKMDEACQLKGQFNHWSETNRNARVLLLSDVIDREDILEIPSRLDLAAYKAVAERWSHVKPGRGDKQKFHSMDQPYVLLFQRAITIAATEAVLRGATEPIEIIFDEQSLLRTTLVTAFDEWRDLERDFPERFAVMPQQLAFRDDKTFLLVQAADMLAGNLRLAGENYEDNPPFVGKLRPKRQVSQLLKPDIGGDEMDQIDRHLQEAFARDVVDFNR